nr:multidrug resistance-associated protein 5 [Tanacetum cinerariifolium]
MTHSNLVRVKPKWYERSIEVRVVAKCGQIPPRVSALEKGKQRKQTKYPCASSDDLPKCLCRCYVRNFNFGALVNYKWIIKIFDDKIRANLDIRLCDITDLVMKEYSVRSYGKAILDFNPRSNVKLGVTMNPDGKIYFDRFYVCFARLIDRWKAGCRKIIALGGGFLKSPNQGEILTAIRRDRNNHIYPVTLVVVNVENKYNWTWFLELLEEDLGCSRGNGLTLMSDQHKGLIESVKDVMPNAEHKQCARHIYENFRKQHPGLEYRQLFWAASKASYPQLFNKIMNKIKSANPNTNKFWHVIPAGGILYEVRLGSEGFTVDKGKRTYSCRMWQLSGLPCVYDTKSMYSTVLPPKPRKIPGRPRKKRIRAVGEGGSSTRVSKVGSQGSCSNYKKSRHNKSSCKEPVVEQTPKPKGVVVRPRKKQPIADFKDFDVVQRVPIRDEGTSRTRGGVIGSRDRGDRRGPAGSRGGANGSVGRGASGSGGASRSRGRGTTGSRGGASGSIGRDTQVEDQVEQTEDQAEIDLTQLEKNHEPSQDKVHPQEQPHQAPLRMPRARILQKKLGKQGSSQNTTLNLD